MCLEHLLVFLLDPAVALQGMTGLYVDCCSSAHTDSCHS